MRAAKSCQKDAKICPEMLKVVNSCQKMAKQKVVKGCQNMAKVAQSCQHMGKIANCHNLQKKHCQRHNGPRMLSPKLELYLKAETNANSNLAL